MQPGWVERGEARRLLQRWLPDRLERLLVRIGLFLSALTALLGVLVAIAIGGGEVTAIPDPTGPIEAPSEPVWILLLALVWVVVGLANGLALVLSLAGRHAQGMAIAQYAVLGAWWRAACSTPTSRSVGALAGVVVQLGLLLLILDQRRRLANETASGNQ